MTTVFRRHFYRNLTFPKKTITRWTILFFTTTFLLLGHSIYGQTKIKIASEKHSHFSSVIIYKLVNISDTIYIEIHPPFPYDMTIRSGGWGLKTDIPDGEYMVYLNDTLNLRTVIKNQRIDSVWTMYFTNGNPSEVKHFKNGQLDGEWIEYHPNGQPAYIRRFKNGKLNGESIGYYEDGSVSMKYFSIEGKVKDFVTIFYKTGQIKYKEYWNADGIFYKRKEYSEDGQLINTTMYNQK